MNLQVQPLKILATREVVKKRMDYSTFLTGTTKEELDRLDMLAGDFKVQASKLTIEAVCDGKKLPSEDWEYLKTCIKLPKLIRTIMEHTQEFTIVELKSGQRNWTMLNVWWKKGMLENRGKLNFYHTGGEKWGHSEDFIEDGALVNVIRNYKMDNGKMILSLDIRKSITTDKEGNIIWSLMWSRPHKGVKITKVVRAVRVLKALHSWKNAQMRILCLYYFTPFALVIFGLLILFC